MRADFSELIEKQKFQNRSFAEPMNCKTGQPQLNINADEELISVRYLGDYYWHQFEETLIDLGAWIQVYNSKKRHSKQWKIEHSLNKQWQYKKLDCLKRVCVILLGKKEVNKRLKELK